MTPEQELESLREWKESAQAVMNSLHSQEIAKEIGVPLGQSIEPAILPWIQSAKELLRQIRDGEVNAEDEADRFLRDHAPSQLSVLKSENDRLRNDIAGIKKSIRQFIDTLPDPIGGLLNSAKP